MNALVKPDGLLDLLTASILLALSVLVLWSLAILAPELQLGLYFGSIAAFVLFFFLDTVQSPNRDIAVYLFLPLFLSATQNLLLGLIAPAAAAVQIQSMTVANFVYACAITAALTLRDPRPLAGNRGFIAVAGAVGLSVYAAVAYVLLGGYLVSVLASLRNVITPFVFFLLGLLAARTTSLPRFLFYVAMLGWFTIAFGIVERFFVPDLWKWLNIAELWQKKGFSHVNPELGVPFNFFSSERLGGVHLRRMVSSYADAVNFGTVLVLFMLVAWYTERKWLALAAVVAIVLAISKGGLIGILVFLVVWAYFNRTKMMFPIVATCAVALAVLFVYYSLNFSSRSMEAHVRGFSAALIELPGAPFGRGLGNIGVLAGVFSRGEESEITESGLGMIIGQLGVPGFLFYGVFFSSIFLRLRTLLDVRAKTLGFAVFWSITLNIVFNEVALSPNSAAGSFLVLGLLCGRHESRYAPQANA